MKLALISVFNVNEPKRTMYEQILYKLLKERKPWQNISHKEIPAYEDHVNFIRKNLQQHKGWYLIQDLTNYDFVGTIYLGVENNVGVFIFKKYHHRGFGKQALKILYELYPHVRQIRANVAPTNTASMCFFLNQGYKYLKSDIIQYVYVITNPFYENYEAVQDSDLPLHRSEQTE